ncbi:uncharacterized protein LOC131617289 [Vicia villosa]|uniref:uncharacterized protein LOC131617289 n=1 Tax=Vicia villosa TaxID=3911 RepID=UPI00273BFA06|nr:uncharacterized protein LOC131617289 [Vicia villosa]
MGLFKVVFFTNGKFVRDEGVSYEGGDVFAIAGQDPDFWSYFEACDLLKSLDASFIKEDVKMWWKSEHGSLENDLKPLVNDEDATLLAMCAEETKSDIEIYTEPKDNVNSEDSEDSESSEDSLDGIHFEDSEEERMNDNDEDVGEEINNSGAGGVEDGAGGVEDGAGGIENGAGGTESGAGGIHTGMMTAEMEREHIIDDDYLTDELDSGADDDSDGGRPSMVKFRDDEKLRKEFKFKVGMEFSSLKQFKKAVLEHNVLNGREVKFAKNDGERCRVICKDKQQCGYTVLCSRVLRTESFRIKTLIQKHKCGRKFFNKNANADWVSRIIVDKLKNNSGMKLNEIVSDVRLRFATEITGCRAFKARQIARRVVEGDSAKQYTMLWSYGAELRRACIGNTFKLNISGLPPKFERCYMCFDGTKRAFKNGCRPFIGLDGCHLKNKYGGILLIAVSRDANDQYLPLAFGVVETECRDSWSWFMRLLLEDIGSDNRCCFISDQQKGLVNVFEEDYPEFEHRFCLRHLYANFKKKFGGGTLYRDLIMAAAKATYFEDHEAKMNQIKEANPDAYEWMNAIPKNKWCKHAFPFYSKCDVLMNNLSESFNATILMQRDKPILTMFEWIRNYLMGRFATLREKVENYKGVIMSKPLRRLDREIEKSASWLPTYAGRLTFQATHVMFTDSFVVDLAKHTCSCNFWDLVGIPCRHAVAAIHRKVDNPINYVHKCYHKSTYVTCYNEVISPINGQNKWPKTTDPEILPPSYKRGPGRPKKLRRREADEESQTRWQRTNTSHRCKICFEYGHNKRTCKKNKQLAVIVGEVPRDVPRDVSRDVPTDVPTGVAPTQGSQTPNVGTSGVKKRASVQIGGKSKKSKSTANVGGKSKKSKSTANVGGKSKKSKASVQTNDVPQHEAVSENQAEDVQAGDVPHSNENQAEYVPHSNENQAEGVQINDVQSNDVPANDVPANDVPHTNEAVSENQANGVPHTNEDVPANDVPHTNEDVPHSQNTVSSAEAMKRYCGIDPDELEALLDDEEILDIAPLRIDTSPVKSKRPGPKTFIGKCPKVPKTVKPSIAPKVSKAANKPTMSTMSDPVKVMISPRKKSNLAASPIRKSDRLRTLKAKNIPGPGRDQNDPLEIPDEDTTVSSASGSKPWADIQKSMTQ